ncbi:MAG: aminoglycoside phosphotransferase family protein [Candidatus Nanoarchaeia archaeon]
MVSSELNLKEANGIFEKELDLKVNSIQNSSFGRDHLVFIANTKKGKFVLRYPLRDKNKIVIQKTVCELWRQKGVLVPKPLVLRKQYLIEECLAGVDAKSVSLSKTETKRLFRDLGSQLKKMHSIREKGYGDLISARKGRYKSWKSYCDSFVYKSLRESLKKGRITKTEYLEARKLYKEHSPYLKAFNKPTLLHGDLVWVNFMVYKRKFSGIIDAADARCGDPLFDLGTMHQFIQDESLMKELLTTYGKVDSKLILLYAWIVATKKVNSYDAKRWREKKKQWKAFFKQLNT